MKMKILYSAGFGRNGGTLLDRILGEVEGFVSLGEFRMVWRKGLLDNELCNCGEPFRNCPFWRAVFQRAFGGMEKIDPAAILNLANSVDRTRYLPLLLAPQRPRDFTRRLASYRDILAALYGAIREESGGMVLVDSSRFAGTGLVLGSLPTVDLHVLHLIRDARASTFSWQRKKRRVESRGKEKFIKRYSPLESSFWWVNRNVSVEMMRPSVDRYLRVRYEDFVKSPRPALESILRFVGEDSAELPLRGDRVVHLGASHTQSGNPSRFLTGDVEIRMDDEWRSAMGRSKKAFVTSMTWPLLLRYGYKLSTRRVRDTESEPSTP